MIGWFMAVMILFFTEHQTRRDDSFGHDLWHCMRCRHVEQETTRESKWETMTRAQMSKQYKRFYIQHVVVVSCILRKGMRKRVSLQIPLLTCCVSTATLHCGALRKVDPQKQTNLWKGDFFVFPMMADCHVWPIFFPTNLEAQWKSVGSTNFSGPV